MVRAKKWEASDFAFGKARFQAVSENRLRIFLDAGAKSLRKIRKNVVGGRGFVFEKLLKKIGNLPAGRQVDERTVDNMANAN